MNCFIWKDDNADIHINSYIALMKKVYHMEDDNLEIELKVNQNKVSK